MFPRLPWIFKFVLAVSSCLLLAVIYLFAPLWEQEYILWRLANQENEIVTSNNSIIEHMPFPKQFKGRKLAFHQVFEPRRVAFVDYNYTVGSKHIKGAPKVILLWTPWNGVYETINYYFLRPGDLSFKKYGCPNSNCRVTKNKNEIEDADAVLFHLLDPPDTFPDYRRSNQRWIAYIMEAPWQVDNNLTLGNGKYNWTMSYREDSDIVVKYGFVGKRLSNIKSNKKSKKKVGFFQKRSVAWFVSDCVTDSRREDYVRELSKYIDIDIYGLCGTKKCFPSQSSVCYEEVLGSYKFYLSFENSICADYVTEKFFNVLEFDAVPIVFGGANYFKTGPPGGFVDAMAFPDPENLAQLLNLIGNSEKEHSKYLDWKQNYQAYLYPWMCYLCDKLHAPLSYTVKVNLYDWWMKEAECKRWTKPEGFMNLTSIEAQ